MANLQRLKEICQVSYQAITDIIVNQSQTSDFQLSVAVNNSPNQSSVSFADFLASYNTQENSSEQTKTVEPEKVKEPEKAEKTEKSPENQVEKEKEPEKKKSFSAVYKDVTTTINKLKERIIGGEEDLAEKMTTIIEQYLGAGKKITEATPAQQDLVEAALAELKEL